MTVSPWSDKMKAIVLEVRNGVAAVLREDGVIEKTRQKCAVGDTIEIKVNKSWFRTGWARAATAAAAVIILGGSGGFYGYNNVMACSYVSLDINPSVEYVLNRQNKVLKVVALNDDAEAVVEELQEQGVRNDTLEEALQKTEIILEEQEFLSDEELDYVLVNVSTDSDTRKELLTEEANKALGMNEERISLVVTDSSVEERDKARELGISAGRYGEMRAIEGEPGGKRMEPDQTMVRKYQEAPVRDMLVNAGQIPEPSANRTEGMQAGVPGGNAAGGQAAGAAKNGGNANAGNEAKNTGGAAGGNAPAADSAGSKNTQDKGSDPAVQDSAAGSMADGSGKQESPSAGEVSSSGTQEPPSAWEAGAAGQDDPGSMQGTGQMQEPSAGQPGGGSAPPMGEGPGQGGGAPGEGPGGR